MIRIAHCIHGLGIGGAQQLIRCIVAHADVRRFRHSVYSSSDGVCRELIAAAGAHIRVIPRRLPKLDPWWALALARAMRADGVDLVHTHLFGDSLHGYCAARLAGGLPVLMTLHNSAEFFTPLQRSGYRWLLARTSRAVACSPAVQRSFADCGDVPQAIPNGLELDVPGVDVHAAQRWRADLGVAAGEVAIAAVGRLVEEKGLGDLLDACAKLRCGGERAFRLVLIGDGPLRAPLEARVRALGLGDCVTFAGFRPNVHELLPACDIVVFSSVHEGLPMALLEAMRAARGIVATRIGGIPDAVRHPHEALLVGPRDAAALAAAMRVLLRDPAERLRLGANARRRFRSAFGAAAAVTAYERVYSELCGAPMSAAESAAATAGMSPRADGISLGSP